ncbi:MAG: pantoate--beta-alanine ligase [Flavobacteriales bacterium]|nr:pantoate--beta-alanine ligase [Flavobacteriales bacterium]
MHIATTEEEVQEFVKTCKSREQKVGFVPTMGALHSGHLSLIDMARSHSDVVVCSIFVNPTQFNEKADLDNYPRTIDADIIKLEEVECDLLFIPEVDGVYLEDHNPKRIDYKGLDKVMEGAMRPGHFDGVVEVVARLFEIVEPELAYFGEKDFQQLAIIRLMVEQLDCEVEIIGCPIVREANGLAMSSRNERLNREQRQQASILHATLQAMKDLVDFLNPDEVEVWGRAKLEELDYCELEYLEVAESRTLQPIFRWKECEAARAFVVARFGDVRLIDNLELYNSTSS